MAIMNFGIELYPDDTGLTLNAQLVDTLGVNSGAAITTGFAEIGTGFYTFTVTIADSFLGGIKLYENGVPATILGFAPLNEGTFIANLAAQVLKMNVSDVEDTASLDSLAALLLATFYSGISGGVWTIRKTDATTFDTKALTTSVTAEPIVRVD